MIINKNSWHARMHDFFYWQRPHSLCQYFWKMAWAIFAISIICVAVVSGSWIVGQGILSHFGVTGFWVLNAAGTGLGALVFATAISAIVGIAYTAAKISTWWEGRRFDKEWKRQQDKENGIEHPKSVLLEYLKARKSKMCPMIEFKDIK